MKMKNWIIGVIVVFLGSSCEDVITVKVDQGTPKLVVDAFVNNLSEAQTIRLTRSIPYFDKPGTEQGVEGATVAIIDTTGGAPKLFLFSDSGRGNYIFHPDAAAGDTFTVGHNYLLFVIESGDTLFSVATMNPTAKIDSLHIKYEDGSTLGLKKGNYVELGAHDLPGFGNTYWIKTFNNDTFKNGIFDINIAYDMTQSPSNQDGGEFIWPIRYGALNDFGKPRKPGEKVRVEIHSISVETYYYFNAIIYEAQNGGLFATPPSNIGTNIFNFSKGTQRNLGGFFSMSEVSRAEVIMP